MLSPSLLNRKGHLYAFNHSWIFAFQNKADALINFYYYYLIIIQNYELK